MCCFFARTGAAALSTVNGGRCINANMPGSQWSRKRTNAGMRPVTMAGKIARSALPPELRELARLLVERLLGRLWRPRQVLFVVTLEPITARDCRFACETYSGWDCCSCSGCRPSKA